MSGRNMMGDAWKIKEENFPEMGEIEEKMRFLLNYAILAPSSHNTQPWKFSIKGNNIGVMQKRKQKQSIHQGGDWRRW